MMCCAVKEPLLNIMLFTYSICFVLVYIIARLLLFSIAAQETMHDLTKTGSIKVK